MRMKAKFFLLFIVMIYAGMAKSFAQTNLPVQWVKSGIHSGANLNPVSVGVDELGNVFTALIISDTFNFSGYQYVPITPELFIAKVNIDGDLLWVKRVDSVTAINTRVYISVRSNGSFFLSGSFSQYLNFGGCPEITSNYQNFYVASFDSSGNAIWARSTGNNNDFNASINVVSISSDAYSNVYVGAKYYGNSLTIGTEVMAAPPTLSEASFIVKFDKDGAFQWAKELNSTPNFLSSSAFVWLTSLRASDQGNTYLYGAFKGDLTVATNNVLSSTIYEYFIIKYDPDGNAVWSKKIGCNGDCLPGVMELDLEENLFVTGSYHIELLLGNIVFSEPSQHHSFVLKYSSNGILLKASEVPDGNDQFLYAYDLNNNIGNGSGVDAAGNFYLTGTYTGNLQLGTYSLSNSGNRDVYVVKYNSDLSVGWLKKLTQNVNSSYNSQGRDIQFDDFGNAYLLGRFNYRADIESSFCTDYVISNNLSSNYDMFLARIWFNDGDLSYTPSACISQNISFKISQALISDATVFSWSFPGASNTSSSLASPVIHYTSPGSYNVSVTISVGGASCFKTLTGTVIVTDCLQEPACADCIPSFSPTTGKNYVVSAWVKEVKASTILTDYVDATLRVKIVGYDEFDFQPEGEIIDGWQRLEGQFFLPNGYDEIEISLLNTFSTSSAVVYFDDVRVSPYDATLKTFVYHPTSKKLMAELDNQNYATIYEYDEDGDLVRVKKETSRGVVTLKEHRKNIRKDE